MSIVHSASEHVWLPSLQVWSRRPMNKEKNGDISFELRQEDDSEKSESDHVCSICLGAIEESASLQWCMHSFCIRCIDEWSKVRRSCPLCKREFIGWYQVAKGQTRQVEKVLSPLNCRPSLDYRLSFAEERRLSMTDFRLSSSDVRLSTDDRPSVERRSSTRNQARMERELVRSTMTFRSRLRLQQLMQSRVNRSYRRSIPLPRQRCFISPAERERLTAEVLSERALSWRSSIYRKGLRAVPLNVKRKIDVRQNDLDSKARTERRLRPWIARELKAVLGDGNHSLLEHLVVTLWFSYNSEDAESSIAVKHGRHTSTDTVSQLEPFVGDNAATFWHELRCYAENPYTMETYDSIVVYVKGEQQH